jgi:heme oxygenase
MSVENLKVDESPTASFLNNLRIKTAASHKGLEALPISKSVVDPQITIEEYALYLSLMHDVVQNLEEDIYPVLSNLIYDLNDRKKAHLLVEDLKHIGSTKTQIISPFKNASEISVPFAMGIMYVIEGSTLGGRFILKNIQENLGFTEEKGASYFAGYGNKTGSFWKNYLNSLTDFEAQNKSEEEIIAGADYAFRIIGKHLSENSAS